MRILVAPDSFKGTLSAHEAASIMTATLREGLPGAVVVPCPLADGGEGTLAVLSPAMDLTQQTAVVQAPMGEQRIVPWAVSRDRRRAVMESATMLGWSTVPQVDRDPLRSWSDGMGMLLNAIHASGIRDIFVGLGGTLTNDAGFGMAKSLGFRFMDRYSKEIHRGPGETVLSCLMRVHEIVSPGHLWWQGTSIHILTDVSNPLGGFQGATQVFGPQKGIPADQLDELDTAILRYAQVIDPEGSFTTRAGAGAAGGLGWALMALCEAEVFPGAEWILDVTGAVKEMEEADLVITGEGRLDVQSDMGKVVGTVSRTAHQLHRPCIAVCGAVRGNPAELATSLGLQRIFATSHGGEGSLHGNVHENLRRTMEDVCDWIQTK